MFIDTLVITLNQFEGRFLDLREFLLVYKVCVAFVHILQSFTFSYFCVYSSPYSLRNREDRYVLLLITHIIPDREFMKMTFPRTIHRTFQFSLKLCEKIFENKKDSLF